MSVSCWGSQLPGFGHELDWLLVTFLQNSPIYPYFIHVTVVLKNDKKVKSEPCDFWKNLCTGCDCEITMSDHLKQHIKIHSRKSVFYNRDLRCSCEAILKCHTLKESWKPLVLHEKRTFHDFSFFKKLSGKQS